MTINKNYINKLVLTSNILIVVGFLAFSFDGRYGSPEFYNPEAYIYFIYFIIYIFLIIALMSHTLNNQVSKKLLTFSLLLNLPLLISLWELGMDISFRMSDDCCYGWSPTFLTYVSQVTFTISGLINISYLLNKLAKNRTQDISN